MKSRLTIHGINKVEGHTLLLPDTEIKYIKETKDHYVFEVKYKEETYEIGIDRWASEVRPLIYDPQTFAAVRRASLVFKGYNAKTRVRLSQFTIKENIAEPNGLVHAIDQYIDWNIELPF